MPSQARRSTCNRDCPDACGLLAQVSEGKILSLRGDPDHPVTKGFLCYRTSQFLAKQDSPDRLRQPLLRKGGRLEPVSMAEALDHAAQRLQQIRQESGPAAIFHYRSGGSLGLLKLVADRFFERFGPCTQKSGDICSGAGEAAQKLDFGRSDSNDLFDLENSRHIYLWGKNPFVSNVHLVPILKKARAAGTRITLIDPVRHQGASLADRVVQPRPGGDLALALGLARLLLDQDRLHPKASQYCDHWQEYCQLLRRQTVAEYAQAADLPVSLLAQMAEDFAQGPTAILVGWGMQRRLHGGHIVRALDALSAVTGNLFRPGGGCSFYFRRRQAFESSIIISGEAPRRIREPLFGQDVLAAKDPPIRALWVTAGNPLCMLPDSAQVAKALAAIEFKVVVDPFLTDTGRAADLVLPVPTLLEDSDLLGAYGHHYLAVSQPLVPPPAGVLHELELFQALAQRVGLADVMAGSIDEVKEWLCRPLHAKGITAADLAQGAIRNPNATALCFPEGRVNTKSGRVNLLTEVPSQVGGEDPAFPLWLFSNSTKQSQASQWVGEGLGQHTWVKLHPSAAAGHREGDLVQVESALGQVSAVLRLDPDQRPDLCIMPKGGHFSAGHSANVLIPARSTDLGLGAAFLDCRVRLR